MKEADFLPASFDFRRPVFLKQKRQYFSRNEKHVNTQPMCLSAVV